MSGYTDYAREVSLDDDDDDALTGTTPGSVGWGEIERYFQKKAGGGTTASSNCSSGPSSPKDARAMSLPDLPEMVAE